MTADACRPWREELGAFVLGQLGPDERAAVQAHLDGCVDCRAERDTLLPLAEILPLADPAWLTEAPAAPRGLGRKVERRVLSQQRNLRRRRLGIGLGLAGATATAAAALVLAFGGGSSGPAGTRVAFTNLPAGVEITGHLTDQPWGTEVSVYVHGMRWGTPCRVFLRGPSGLIDAGSFRYSHEGDAGSSLGAAIALDRARAIEIRAGHRTFTAPIPSSTTA